MSYATRSELIATLGKTILDQLASDADEMTVDQVLDEVLDDASVYIDGYLGGIYIVPVTAEGSIALLRPHCKIIAKAFLIERKLSGRYDPEGTQLFNATKEWLARIAKRQVSLPDAELPSVTTATSTGRSGSDVRIFGDPNTSGSGGALL